MKRIIIAFLYLGLIPLLLVIFLIGNIKLSQYNLQDVKGPVPASPQDGLTDIRGQIHVHFYRSHDSKGTLEEITEAAKSAGVSWVILTDHPSPKWEAPEFNYPVKQDGVLVIFGREHGDWQGQGRYLTAPLRNSDNQLRAYSYVEKFVNLKNHQWDAIEIVNFNTNFRQRPLYLLRGYKGMFCVLPKNIRYWQMLSEKQGKPVPIFAATDAHCNLKYFGIQIDPYDFIFKLVSTHILLAAETELSEDSVIRAIKKGRTYIAFDCLADPTGFQFIAKKNKARFFMGDTVNRPDELMVKIPLAQGSETRIFRDNKLILQRKDMKEFYFFNPESGFWRVEIYRDGLPWITSGQILVTSN